MANIVHAKKDKYSDVFERLNFLQALYLVDQFELKRLKREAETFKANASDRGVGYFLLGALCSLEFDLEGTKSNFQASLATIDQDKLTATLINQATVLQNIYQFKDSADIYLDLHNLYRDDTHLLRHAIVASVKTLYLDKWDELMVDAQKLNFDPFDNTTYTRTGSDDQKSAIRLIKSMGIPYSDVSDRVQSAGDYLFSRKLKYRGSLTHILKTGEISYQFFLDVSTSEAAQVSLDVAMHLIENFEDPLSDLITISCLSK
jgi:hypothetical protein